MRNILRRIELWCLFLGLLLFPLSGFAHGISDEDKRRMLDGGYMEYVILGAKHMITGYDHMLFLFGVMFFLTSIRDVIKFITVFTAGHSITLIFATFFQITANYFLIDAFIALTVCYKGFDNINGFQKYLGIQSPDILSAVFFFGLVHGFGLSTRLQQLPLGNDEVAILFRIISFNVGVEIGQIAALTIMIWALTIWRRRPSFEKFSSVTNALIIFLGVLLLLMQLHGYAHNKYPDDFGFSQDLHTHAHADMNQNSTAEDTQKLDSENE